MTPSAAPSRLSSTLPARIAPVEEIVADLRAGRMVILVDEEDRENEGDLMLAAEHVTPEAINFMATHARGLICLTLTRERCGQLGLAPMTGRNGTRYGTAFTTSIEAAQGVTTGISAADRARTIEMAVKGEASDIVQPGHVFPIQAVEGGVLMRAGHTEAGCDLARMAGCAPAAVICEIMNEDGTMARLPELRQFAAQHGLKIGTIADLIEHRIRNESLIRKVASRPLQTVHGEFVAHAYRDVHGDNLHLALVKGNWDVDEVVPVRVHEPLSLLDALETGRKLHSWSLEDSLRHIQRQQRGVVVLLNCGESADQLLAQFDGVLQAAHAPAAGSDLRNYGIGAQILRECGARKLHILGPSRRMPSMAGYDLEVAGFTEAPDK
ncbi:MAG: 3,4-dihydroxy-2-butanone-4-phosphate synthase [Brachymonas sp.]|nr:3,4-dihydroxy-2-butanone-4-phosphate synthase [Brachymonas sp.]MBP8794707.1 3,4-dihydroxy-2-butanone-4-phosphate synthase [Brachymonas sp.]MBP8821617.1 3,4-dihydroxy-2-butanone-4-phosphate synthase [Brachymonas sp.]